MLEIGTRVEYNSLFSYVSGVWTIHGYVYYESALYYVCMNDKEKTKDFYYKSVKQV